MFLYPPPPPPPPIHNLFSHHSDGGIFQYFPSSPFQPLWETENLQLMETLSIQAGFAQLAERPIEKTGTILMWVQVPGAARDFCPKVNFQCRLSYIVHTASPPPPPPTTPPMCNHSHSHLHTHEKSQTLAAIPLFGHMKILHAMIGMGSTALVAAVPYPGKATWISRMGQRSTKKNLKNTHTLCTCSWVQHTHLAHAVQNNNHFKALATVSSSRRWSQACCRMLKPQPTNHAAATQCLCLRWVELPQLYA